MRRSSISSCYYNLLCVRCHAKYFVYIICSENNHLRQTLLSSLVWLRLRRWFMWTQWVGPRGKVEIQGLSDLELQFSVTMLSCQSQQASAPQTEMSTLQEPCPHLPFRSLFFRVSWSLSSCVKTSFASHPRGTASATVLVMLCCHCCLHMCLLTTVTCFSLTSPQYLAHSNCLIRRLMD